MKIVATFVLLIAAASAQDLPTDGVALAISGYQGGVSLELTTPETHCDAGDATQPLPNAPQGQVEGGSSEYVDGKVYQCCGSNVNIYDACFSLTLGNENWDDAGATNYAREYGASCVFNGEMMVFGGYNDRNGWTDIVEKKDAGSDNWQIMSDWKMPRLLFDFCAAQVDETHLMIVGGNEAVNNYVPNVSILDTETGEWRETEPLPGGRAEHECLVGDYNGERGLYLTGGCTDYCQTQFSDTWFFSFTSETWTELASMSTTRARHRMAYVGDQIAVVGGAVPSGPIATIEVFDGETWQVREEVLTFPRSSFGMPKYLPQSEVDCM